MRFIALPVFAAVLFLASAAYALPPIPNYIPMALEGKEQYKAYLEGFKVSMAKCASCHIPGADKKAKGHALNDFGQAVHKHLDDKAFMAAEKAKKEAMDAKNEDEIKKQNDIALKLFVAAWDKAIQEKNEEGQAFAELLKAGKLPGKNPVNKD